MERKIKGEYDDETKTVRKKESGCFVTNPEGGNRAFAWVVILVS